MTAEQCGAWIGKWVLTPIFIAVLFMGGFVFLGALLGLAYTLFHVGWRLTCGC